MVTWAVTYGSAVEEARIMKELTFPLPVSLRLQHYVYHKLQLRRSVRWIIQGSMETRIQIDQNHVSRRMRTVQASAHIAHVLNYGNVDEHGRWVEIHTTCGLTGRVEHTRVNAPTGYVFFCDSMGPGIRRISDGRDYHASRYELRDPLSWHAQLLSLDARRDQQAEQARQMTQQSALFEQDLSTTRVTYWDSLRAGNCAQGTQIFALRQFGIKPDDLTQLNGPTVPARALVATTEPRARAAAYMAWQRETLVMI